MAEQGGDIGARLFASGQLGGPKGAADDSVNNKDALQAIFEASDKTATYYLAKIGGLPVNLSGVGSTSALAQFESEGLSGKMLPSMFQNLGTQGGFLAKLMHDIFVKNREITDHTTGVGGDASGSGGSGGGGDGGGGGGDWGSGGSISHFDGGGADYVPVTVSALPTGGDRFDWGEAIQPIGGFTPSYTPSQGVSSSAGMEM